MYAAVSRAGVHKRLKEGRLTAFLYHVTETGEPPGGGEAHKEAGRAYTYIPVQECRAWAEQLKFRGRRGEPAEERRVVPPRPAEEDQSWRQW